MLHKLLLPVAAVALISACSSAPPTVQTGDDAEVIGENLHRVDNTRADMAYIDPNADFSKYRKVMLRPLGVDNVEIVQPDRSTSVNTRRDWELTDSDKQTLQQIYHDAMVKQLGDKGDFEIVDTADDDVLEIAAMITGLAPSAAKDDNRSRPVGRSYVITEGAGAIAVAVAFGDSETGEVLALVKDSRTSNDHWGLNNSVSNRADVQRVFTSWAMQINTSLGKITGQAD
ncbi:DUF3313 domain-containing protein [Halioglobus japonicus]|uniref:DUF3313 domain-containing protein n=1 Tax=Halioglobus japonicus TaxID=930805 RepID=A0AAP8SNI9_9GAMM|nr:DUF3313 family protein [Halioglobus japonicus]AQA18542.1 DUF3313 domain-containing protein [Halioglobus japonicus]PLW86564.1 DUF3313 domain-containing protein [Halioglobus japonicus]GHD12228.1 hypothetical protein GCM10007052_12830 [Halioglobus japonicus]